MHLKNYLIIDFHFSNLTNFLSYLIVPLTDYDQNSIASQQAVASKLCFKSKKSMAPITEQSSGVFFISSILFFSLYAGLWHN